MKKPILKGYYGGIFFEYVLQDRIADAVVILPGFPSRNDHNDLIESFFEKGFHVFVPKYRGSYQSSGKFLLKNPVDDLIMFAENMDKGIAKSLWDNSKQHFKINKKILVGSSFGGAIALGLAAKSGKFSHLILASPIWDFRKHNENWDEQNLQQVLEYVTRAYENCYRINFDDFLKRMKKFKELYPEFYLSKLQKMPVLVMHDPNDKIVAFKHTKNILPKFANATYIEHYLGHGLSDSLINAYWKDIDKFIKINYLGENKS